MPSGQLPLLPRHHWYYLQQHPWSSLHYRSIEGKHTPQRERATAALKRGQPPHQQQSIGQSSLVYGRDLSASSSDYYSYFQLEVAFWPSMQSPTLFISLSSACHSYC